MLHSRRHGRDTSAEAITQLGQQPGNSPWRKRHDHNEHGAIDYKIKAWRVAGNELR
jgi:hypothetical protein